MDDLLRLGVLFVVLLDPPSAAIGAASLTGSRSSDARRAVVGGGALVAFAVLAAIAAVSEPLLDALDISTPAAHLAAGLVVAVAAVDALWWGPAGRVRPDNRAGPGRLALFPYGVPLLAGPAAAASTVAWSAVEGRGIAIGGVALALGVVSALVWLWRRPPTGTAARALGGLSAAAMALVAFDLVRDGVFGT